MNNTPFFSILIPVYKNVEYLKECVSSVLDQYFDDFEIILCFQGETTPQVPIPDDRIHVLYLEKPSLYLARIESFKKAKGQYVWFVDSDDSLMPGALFSLHALILQTHFSDVYQFGYTNSKSGGSSQYTNKFLEQNKADYLEYFLTGLGTYPIWRKCFKKKNVSFYDEDIFMGEDGLLSLAFIEQSKTVVVSHNKYYFYRPNPKSGTANLKPKYLDDLCIFLLHTIKYRRKKAELAALIYTFLTSYLTFSCSLPIDALLGQNNVRKMANIIMKMPYRTRPSIIKKTFEKCVLNKNGESCKFGLLTLRIMKKFNFHFKVRISADWEDLL